MTASDGPEDKVREAARSDILPASAREVRTFDPMPPSVPQDQVQEAVGDDVGGFVQASAEVSALRVRGGGTHVGRGGR